MMTWKGRAGKWVWSRDGVANTRPDHGTRDADPRAHVVAHSPISRAQSQPHDCSHPGPLDSGADTLVRGDPQTDQPHAGRLRRRILRATPSNATAGTTTAMGSSTRGVTSVYFLDTDQDGFGNDDTRMDACAPLSSLCIETGGDCNDLDPAFIPAQSRPATR